MTPSFFAPRLFDGQQWQDNVLITIDKGVITALEPDQSPTPTSLPIHGVLVPGFVDVQVNGGGGVMFNQSPTVESLSIMAKAHSRFGTTSLLPTVITDSLVVMERAADAVAEALADKSITKKCVPQVKGIHFEGPHLSSAKKGVHSEKFIRSISDEEFALFCRRDLGTVMVTVAPENVSPSVISELVKEGVVVALGHSNATADIVTKALDAGASGFTHLFNAMSPITGREPGMVGTALMTRDAYCGLIVDFEHVHPMNCQLAMQQKTADKIVLVTDAMAHVGSDETQIDFFDTTIIRHQGKLTLPNGTLAGSVLDMATAVRNTHQTLGLSLADALTMATTTPASFIGQGSKLGAIKVGLPADMVWLDAQLGVEKVWVAGEEV
ncbi:N-acetylglucosamine-6-phosphate deacetylase [Marinibactrum halimedae]|uniref:N-acetylgalactosamine-6-phosphate deacetylase n=1 Tax=Marinibactrum halimedae TaxID=1444977 RepID=A0AA37WLD6_9GAMM|nr:N-acetylglucosamine-6-phosphate deacetylase [Marinibactrum halimedae]MCD9460715.1 N-acetylglucosamine-6-phosphate deacetylase [Marinibactrum halimedae]GLS25160.1 N-acetylgalactosamine-6-phosphate deacetylase [Marinibactrum halimedae]